MSLLQTFEVNPGAKPAATIIILHGLGGFSQGCAITLGAGLRYRHTLAGLLGMSGYMPLAGSIEAERGEANRSTPVFQAHGRNDPVINISRAVATRDQLVGLQQPVEWHDYPMEHSVCIEEVRAIETWLRQVLSA